MVYVHRLFSIGFLFLLLVSLRWPTAVAQAEYVLSTESATDDFGRFVAIDGDVAMVGAFKDDESGTDAGAVFVYRLNGDQWIEEQKLTPSDPFDFANFGSHLALSGNVAIVAAQSAYAAYIFRWNGKQWVEEQKLTTPNGSLESFGNRVAVQGEVAMVNAWNDDAAGPNTGSVYVFRWNGSSWEEEQLLTASDASPGDRLSLNSLAMSEDLAIVGAIEEGGQFVGAAYIFRWDGEKWVEEQKLTDPSPSDTDIYGFEVSISGDFAVVGALGARTTYVYRWNGTEWLEEQRFVGSGNYSFSVHVNEDVLLASDLTRVWLYRWDETQWVFDSTLLPASAPPDEQFGFSTAVSDGRAIIGSPTPSTSGSAYIYEIPPLDVADEEGIAHSSYSRISVEAYPNPARDQVMVRFNVPTPGPVSITLFDVLGREVVPTTTVEAGRGWYGHSFDVRRVPAGLYTLRIAMVDGRTSSRVVVAR